MAPWLLIDIKSTFVMPVPLPVNVPEKFTPLAPLVTTPAGSCASGMTPASWPTATVPETAAAVSALADVMA